MLVGKLGSVRLIRLLLSRIVSWLLGYSGICPDGLTRILLLILWYAGKAGKFTAPVSNSGIIPEQTYRARQPQISWYMLVKLRNLREIKWCGRLRTSNTLRKRSPYSAYISCLYVRKTWSRAAALWHTKSPVGATSYINISIVSPLTTWPTSTWCFCGWAYRA